MTDETPPPDRPDAARTDGGVGSPQRTAEVLSESALEASYPEYRDQVRHSEHLEERDGDTVPAEAVLRPELAARLEYDLFTHQAEGLDHLADGNNVVATTSTTRTRRRCACSR